MFNKNSFEVDRFNHGDLHIGNWKIQPYKDHYRLVIFDFGSVGIIAMTASLRI